MKQRSVREVLQIEGMTCPNCEMRIENALTKLEGVIDVQVIFSSSEVYITYDVNILGLEPIIKTIEKLHYTIRNKSGEPLTSRTPERRTSEDKMPINQLLGIGIILFALYLIIKNTIGFNFIPEINKSMGYGILFAAGLLTSLHCLAMCGGINLIQCITYKFNTGDPDKFSKLKPGLLYNCGRVVSYTIIGGMAGALGSVITFSGAAKGIVAVISGIFMVIMGLNMLNIFPWLRKLNPRMPKVFGNKIYNNNGKHGPFYIGLLNGLMPCGPLQAMQIYALGTGNFAAGATSMFLFGLGTVPLMFGFGAISSLLSSKFTHKMLKVCSTLVIILGIVMVNRGLALSGMNIALASSSSGSVAKVEGGIQTVNTKLEPDSYKPIIVQKGIPVKWIIMAEQADLNGCNNSITIPKYNLQKKLVPGDNIIEFTPEEEGNIVFSCWMGMISSNIKVVSELTKVTEQDIQQAADSGAAGVTKGKCCVRGSKTAELTEKIPADKIAIGKINQGEQYVSINVNDSGFSPAVIVIQKGIKTKWVIKGERLNSCNDKLFFPQYNATMFLKEGENLLNFTPEKDFAFSCSMGMLNGYVKVVDDLNNVNMDDIKKEVRAYNPPAGPGCRVSN
jgi:sulfite exporter TauE/SafE/plastocyanin domain-containing protein/copper chaperone CopZ